MIPIREQRDIATSVDDNHHDNHVTFHEVDNLAGHDAVFAERNAHLFAGKLNTFFGCSTEAEEHIDASPPRSSFLTETVLNISGDEEEALKLPFDIPADCWLHDVGQSAEVRHLESCTENGAELFVKLEGANPTGSIKDKAIANIVLRMYLPKGRKVMRDVRDSWFLEMALF